MCDSQRYWTVEDEANIICSTHDVQHLSLKEVTRSRMLFWDVDR
jgi:hypothetical protein